MSVCSPGGRRLALALALALAGLLALGAAGCARFAYDRLDWMATRWLDGYLDLQPRQRAATQVKVAAQLERLRGEALPQYAAWLRTLRAEVLAGMTPAQVERHYDLLEDFARDLGGRGLEDAADLLAGLQPVQLAYLEQRLARRNEEVRREWVDPPRAELQARRVQALRKQLTRWFGPLTPAQEAGLARWAERAEPLGQARLDQRLRWQQELLRAVRESADRDRLRARLEPLLVRPETLATPLYRERLARNREALAALLSELSGSLTPAQREHFDGRVEEWLSALASLARPAAPRYAQTAACPEFGAC